MTRSAGSTGPPLAAIAATEADTLGAQDEGT